MNIILHIPVVMSFVLLAAHFYRYDHMLFVVFALACPFLLLLQNKWGVRVVQLALVGGAIEWIRTLLVLQAIRAENGMAWTRLAFIIGGVALFTAFSALVFYHTSLQKKYRLHKGRSKQ